jgi:intracellular sulfur oxidation DsrE/DsrF family protein
MSTLQGSTQRRKFLGTLASGAAAIGIAALSRPLGFAAGMKPPPGSSDLGTFESWLGQIKGAHKQVFDSPDPKGGIPLIWTRVFLMSNKAVGVADGDACGVLILRHSSIGLTMPDGMWEKYGFGELFKVDDPATKKPAVRNPYYNSKPGDLMLPDASIDELLKSGVLIGVCDMALTVYSGVVAKKMNMDAAEIKKEWVASIIPGIQVVPSGVLAVNRTQEHGCTYCFAG